MNEGVLQNFDIPAEYMTIMDLRTPKLHYELSEKQKKHLSKKKLNESNYFCDFGLLIALSSVHSIMTCWCTMKNIIKYIKCFLASKNFRQCVCTFRCMFQKSNSRWYTIEHIRATLAFDVIVGTPSIIQALNWYYNNSSPSLTRKFNTQIALK